MIDWSLRVGDLVSFGGFVMAGIIGYFGLKQTVALVLQRVKFLEEDIEEKHDNLKDELTRQTAEQNKKIDQQSIEIGKLGELLLKAVRTEERLARQDEHIVMIRKEIDEIKHGQGFINGPRLANAANP